MEDKIALIVGVTGIVGMNLAKKLIQEKWTVYGISRRKPDYLPKEIHHVAADLLNGEACKENFKHLTNIKYVFCSTWINKGSEKENCVANAKMIENLLDNLPSKLKHFVLVTGTKHYMGPFDMFDELQSDEDKLAQAVPTPFRETIPRLPYPNFYYDQEDIVFDRAAKNNFTWSVARPHTVIGFAPNNQMNLGTSLAVYASICKHLNVPFIFPGIKKAYGVYQDATEVNLLAEHLIWEATDPKCQNQAFNVVNGDIYRWRTMWNTFAEYFGVQTEEPGDKAFDLQGFMKDKGPVWDEIVQKHGLQKFSLDSLAVWWHVVMDVGRVVGCPTDMSKSREMGFNKYQTTDKAYLKLFDYLRQHKYIP